MTARERSVILKMTLKKQLQQRINLQKKEKKLWKCQFYAEKDTQGNKQGCFVLNLVDKKIDEDSQEPGNKYMNL